VGFLGGVGLVDAYGVDPDEFLILVSVFVFVFILGISEGEEKVE